jgi:2-keto-4-pentenoate hydratase/2-oxohepta-3-ene-1,7-dioic acid hydratase in catechol pathway
LTALLNLHQRHWSDGLGVESATLNMRPGDVVEIEISGIGTLRHYVVAKE